MFQVVACYFPITFKPSPNDPYGITHEGLVQALRRCLRASPLFAVECMDLLLDKETSIVDETKVGPLERTGIAEPGRKMPPLA